jgi:Fanconi anemia group M protein
MTFLDIFSNKKEKKEELKITIDHREKNSLVVSELMKLGFKIQFEQLPVADYLIENTAIERKTLSDFKSSIINKRIISQLLEMKQYPRHLLILEGLESEDPYSGAIHENAFRGFLLSVALEYKTPIIFTLNEKDTAKYLYVMAKKKKKVEYAIRPAKIILSEKERLQFILEGFPGIGPSTAKKLLNEYKTIKQISNAPLGDLEKFIGKKAILLYKFFNYAYL